MAMPAPPPSLIVLETSASNGQRTSLSWPMASLRPLLSMGALYLALNLSLVLATSPQSVTLLWKTKVGCLHWGPGCWVPGFHGTDSSAALLFNDSLVIGAYGNLMVGNMWRVGIDDGKIKWSAPQAGGEGSPAVSQAGVIFTSTYGGLLALDPGSGERLWEWRPTDGGQIGSSGALDEHLGLIFVGTLKDGFYAVNVSNGRTVWSYSTSSSGGCSGEVWSSLGALGVGDHVYFGSGGTADVSANCSSVLHCLDKASGAVQWRSRTGIQIQGRAGFSQVSERVYIGDYDHCLYAFNSTTGVREWKSCTNGRLEASATVVSMGTEEIVIIGSGDGHVYGFRGSDGVVIWNTKLGKPVSLLGSGGVGSTAALYEDEHGTVATMGGPDAMWGLDAQTGAVRWRWAAPSKGMFGSSPLVKDGKLYVGGEDGYLYALALP